MVEHHVANVRVVGSNLITRYILLQHFYGETCKMSDDDSEKKEKKGVKKAGPKKAAPKKAGPKKAGPKKAAPKKAGPKKAAPKKAAPKKAAPKKAGPKAPPKAEKKESPPPEKGIIENFKNEFISFEKETLPNCRVKFTVNPQQPLWDKAEKTAIKKIAKEISIPGFRKGKAPASLILKKHPEQVKESTESAIADLCFSECQKEARVPILHGNNNVSFHFGKDDDEKTLFFSFESEPEIPALNVSDFSLKATDDKEIDEKRVDEEVDQVRSFYATWEEITDRGIEEGDFVLLDIDDMDGDAPVQVFNGARFEVKEEKMATWMRDLVVGKNKDDVIEGISEPEASASEEDKESFKKKKVRITIKTVEKSTLPEVDEELAKKVGTKDVAEMKQNLKNLIKMKADRERIETLRSDIEKQMIDKVIFEVPATLLEKEANHRVSQLFSNPAFKKKWEEELSEEEKDERKEEIKEKATQAIRLFYLCRDIIGKNNIPVGDEDMQSSCTSVLEMMYADQSKLQYQSMSEDQKQMALTQVMMHKAEEHIISELEKSNR